MSDSTDYFSLKEVRDKIEREYRRELPTIRRNARRHCEKLRDSEPEDLIHEAIERFLDGRRRWRKDLLIIQALNGAVRSIAYDKYQKEKILKNNIELEDEKILDTLHSYNKNPEYYLIKEDEEREILNLFNDREIFFIHLLLSGYIKNEIMKNLSLTETKYASLRRKILRRIKSYHVQ